MMPVHELFERSPSKTSDKLGNFTKYIRRQDSARYFAQYEIFKRQLNIKGSVIECGVRHGGGVMAWAQISATLEPYNYHRKIFGFDTFEGFPDISDRDTGNNAKVGFFAEEHDIHSELLQCIKEYDENRFINHKQKVYLIKGDANVTIPSFIEENKHVLISLLYLDFDIYEPTKTAIKNFLPRMPKGAIICFDEVNNPDWPGETLALLEELDIRHCRLECFEFEPNISFIQLD